MNLWKKLIQSKLYDKKDSGYVIIEMSRALSKKEELNMSIKRRDKKGRILKDGEYQRGNGQYEYKFLDSNGERRSVYSWKLLESDSVPLGKHSGVSLREKEREIQKKIDQKIIIAKSATTLNDLFTLHMSIIELSNATRLNYMYMWERFVEKELGNRRVDMLKKTDILKFYAEKKKDGMADGTIQMFHKLINPSLQLAVEDNIIPFNPARGCCKAYSGTNISERTALTKEQVDIFFEELKKYKSRQDYETLFRIMLGLACRRGEIIGLTWKDVNMSEKTVTINHSVLYRMKDGKRQFYAKSTKTGNSRTIPMTNEVYNCFIKLQEKRKNNMASVEVDGYKDFVFTTSDGKNLISPENLNIVLRTVVERYNQNADKPLPKISTHIFRHTGCTRMAEAGVDINTLCYIMGHKSYKMVLKVYDHVNLERARNQMKKLDHLPEEKTG